ncbi:MAG: hypothetical protein JWP10_1282 [Nocardioidaceae bacterium]|nr:hypothetical protein [Nocardioidaceae bacterium]
MKGRDGRYYLDVAWDEFGVAVEIHGIPHQRIQRWDADMLRANEIVIGGRRLIAFSSYAIRREQQLVADQLHRLLTSAGWDGSGGFWVILATQNPQDRSAHEPSGDGIRSKY